MAETRYICKHSDGMGHCNISDDGYCSGPCTLEKDIEYSQVRHGRWIYHHDDLFPAESKQECSRCHEEEYLTLYNENYCPNCGAKMDGGAD